MKHNISMKRVWQQLMTFAIAFFMLGAFMTINVKAANGIGDIKQTEASTSSVTLTFADNSGISKPVYRAVVYADAACTKELFRKNCSTNEAYLYSNMTAGSSYWVKIGVGDTLEAADVNLSEAIEVVTKPSEVTSVSFVSANEKTVRIQWTAAAGADGYIIETKDGRFAAKTNSYDLPIANATYANVYPVRVSKDGYIALGSYGTVYRLSLLTTNIEDTMFGLSAVYNSFSEVGIRTGIGGGIVKGHGWEAEGAPIKGKGKKIKITDKYLDSSVSVPVTSNTMYKYHVRTYVTLSNGQKQYGNWSGYKYFMATKGTKFTTGERGRITLSWKKPKGVDRIVIKASKSKDKGFKKIATVKPGKKKYVMTKFKKKALKRYQNYYFRVEYQVKIKGKYKTSEIIGGNSSGAWCR